MELGSRNLLGGYDFLTPFPYSILSSFCPEDFSIVELAGRNFWRLCVLRSVPTAFDLAGVSEIP